MNLLKAFLSVVLTLFTGSFAFAGETQSDLLFKALANPGSVGKASSSCSYELQKGPPPIVESSRKFEFSAISIKLSRPFTFENKYGYQKVDAVKLMIIGEPLITQTLDPSGQPLLMATFVIFDPDNAATKLVVLVDKQAKIISLSGEKEVGYLDGKPLVLKEIFDCRQ